MSDEGVCHVQGAWQNCTGDTSVLDLLKTIASTLCLPCSMHAAASMLEQGLTRLIQMRFSIKEHRYPAEGANLGHEFLVLD